MSNGVFPQQPNPFGTCLWTGPDANGFIGLDPSGRMATGRDVLTQSLVRRQTTARGSVINAPGDCLDVTDYLKASFTPAALAAIGIDVQQELSKDARLKSCTVAATYDGIAETLTLTESFESLYGPFQLVVSVSQAKGLVVTVSQ